MVVNKPKLLSELISKVRSELDSLQEALNSSKDLATNAEFKAESKYDTRALEAAYLASAEAKRIEELKLDIEALESVDLDATRKFQEIHLGAIVTLKHGEQNRTYFLLPTCGGTILGDQELPVLVVSVFSPIGDAMLGLKKNEEFEIQTPKENRLYQVVDFT